MGTSINITNRCCDQQQVMDILEKIMTQVSDLAAKLGAVNVQLSKAAGEIVSAVDALRAEIQLAGTLSAAGEAELTTLTTIAQSLDDLNPDAVTA